MKFLDKLRVYRWQKLLKQLAPFMNVSPTTILTNSFSLRLDNPMSNRKYLEIGDDCVVDGHFVFESDEGKITIGNHSHIGGSTFISRSSISIGNNVTIAWGGVIYDHDSHSMNHIDRRRDVDLELEAIRSNRNFIANKDWSNVNTKPIVIEDDTWIGMNVTILKGVTIGRGAIVGAGSVVTRDVPAWTVAVGNPAKVIKKIEH